MKAFVARGVTLGLETSVESHNTGMGVGPRYLYFLSILKGMGLSAYTGWTTLHDLFYLWFWTRYNNFTRKVNVVEIYKIHVL
jgi:hypothetical protein